MFTRRRLLCALPAWGISLTSCSSPGPLAAVPQPTIVSVTQWGGTPTPLPERAQTISHITIHHQGEIWDPAASVPAYLVRLQNWSRGIKGWSDIPYHYIVAPDGTVYAARPWQIPGDTNTEYQPQGHALLMLLGNFEVQYPTEAQMQATAWLLARLGAHVVIAGGRLRWVAVETARPRTSRGGGRRAGSLRALWASQPNSQQRLWRLRTCDGEEAGAAPSPASSLASLRLRAPPCGWRAAGSVRRRKAHCTET